MFILCRQCGEEKFNGECPHDNPADRQFTGTWVVDEVMEAVRMGYKVLRVYGIWQYKIRQHGVTKEPAIFLGYVHHFLKMKVEASGWPDWCRTEDQKAQYIADLESREGVKLDPSNIEVNPGRRELAKIVLNSFWGKFGQRDDLMQNAIMGPEEVE